MRKKPKDVLTEMQREILSQVSRRSTEARRTIERANIVLGFAEGTPKRKLARHLGLSIPPVRKWIRRWTEAQPDLLVAEAAIEKAEDHVAAMREYRKSVLKVLDDAARPGIPPTFSAEQIAQIVAIACETLDESEDGVSYRTHKEIAAEAVRRGIVESISRPTIGVFLKSGRGQAA